MNKEPDIRFKTSILFKNGPKIELDLPAGEANKLLEAFGQGARLSINVDNYNHAIDTMEVSYIGLAGYVAKPLEVVGFPSD
jgi:hypothetical protein